MGSLSGLPILGNRWHAHTSRSHKKAQPAPRRRLRLAFGATATRMRCTHTVIVIRRLFLKGLVQKKASSKEIFVRPNGQRSCYENKPVRIAIGERGKEDECGEVEVGGCVSPHPRQRGRWFDWSHNTRVKTQPVCPALACTAPQQRTLLRPGIPVLPARIIHNTSKTTQFRSNAIHNDSAQEWAKQAHCILNLLYVTIC